MWNNVLVWLRLKQLDLLTTNDMGIREEILKQHKFFPFSPPHPERCVAF